MSSRNDSTGQSTEITTSKSTCSAFCTDDKSYWDTVEGQQKWEESIKGDFQHEPRAI